MKRPRRPVKKAPRKAPARKARKSKPIFNLKIGTKDDPFHVDPIGVPKGVSMQWLGATSIKGAQEKGWRRVPRVEPVGGLALMWAPENVAAAQIKFWVDKAQEQRRMHSEPFALNEPKRWAKGGIPIMPPDFLVGEEYNRIASDAPPIIVEFPVSFSMPAVWQDAASALHLSNSEYARRRVLMAHHLITPDHDGIFHAFDLTTRKVD